MVLLGAHLFLSAVLLYTFHRGYLHISTTDFFVTVALIFAGALYRPRWAFWFFVGTLPYELFVLTPDGFPLTLRLYQVIGLAALLGTIVAVVRGRLRVPRLHVVDYSVAAIVTGGFLALLVGPAGELRETLVLASFVVLYVLVRFFIRTPAHAVRPLLFFGIATAFVVVYAIAQNWLYIHLGGGHEVMPGRPNSTFSEADWLGMFLVFALGIVYSTIFFFETPVKSGTENTAERSLRRNFVIYSALLFLYCAIIITVARSAWLGALSVHIVFIALSFWRQGLFHSVRIACMTALVGLVAYGIVVSLPLTDFRLTQRAASVGGDQTITVACDDVESATQLTSLGHVATTHELTALDCVHINLEDIAAHERSGDIVTTVTRDDPNVQVRTDTYAKVWHAISERPVIGHGWGSSATILGTDASGTQLNSSNIFLEVWLGSGLLGLVGLITIFCYAATMGIVSLVRTISPLRRAGAVMIILTSVGLVVTNLFNAGVFLGFLWLYFALIPAVKLKQ